jgi:hypothetical protein
MTPTIARDRSRDRRIEDPTNLWIIHPLAHGLVRPAIRLGISANVVSVMGLFLGLVAAACFYRWRETGFATAGLVVAAAWLVADGLDGMVARATGTASAVGRLLDGLCDHGAFVLMYLALILSLGTAEAWALALVAGIFHALQSSLYEGERTRFHRRAQGIPAGAPPARAGTLLESGYDRASNLLERAAAPFERRLAASPDPAAFGRTYAARAALPMRFMALLSANTRLLAIWLACVAGDPKLFWWFEIIPLSVLAIVTILWHRRVEAALAFKDAEAPQSLS